jgi:hypothetical protein
MTKENSKKLLSKLDSFLLENRPLLWSSKIIYVLYYCCLFSIANVIIVCLIKIDISHIPNTNLFLTGFIILPVLISIIWLASQNMLRIRYLYPKKIDYLNIKIILLYIIISMVISFSCLLPLTLLSYRVKMNLTDAKFPNKPTSTFKYDPSFGILTPYSGISDSLRENVLILTKNLLNDSSKSKHINLSKYNRVTSSDSIRDLYDQMPSEERNNISIAQSLFGNTYNTFGFDSIKKASFIALNSLDARTNQPTNSRSELRIYYNNYTSCDTILSTIFQLPVFIRKIEASKNLKDTIVCAYYITSGITKKHRPLDIGNIQRILLEESTYLIESKKFGNSDSLKKSVIKKFELVYPMVNYYNSLSANYCTVGVIIIIIILFLFIILFTGFSLLEPATFLASIILFALVTIFTMDFNFVLYLYSSNPTTILCISLIIPLLLMTKLTKNSALNRFLFMLAAFLAVAIGGPVIFVLLSEPNHNLQISLPLYMFFYALCLSLYTLIYSNKLFNFMSSPKTP